MTVREVLKTSGIQYNRTDEMALGQLCKDAAVKNKVGVLSKIRHTSRHGYRVNDYDEVLRPVFEEVIVMYFQRKAAAE